MAELESLDRQFLEAARAARASGRASDWVYANLVRCALAVERAEVQLALNPARRNQQNLDGAMRALFRQARQWRAVRAQALRS